MRFTEIKTAPELSLPLPLGSNARVSAASIFSDEVWDFTNEIGDVSLSIADRRINWKFQITEERNSLDPLYGTMVLALKQLVYTLLFSDKPRKYVGVVRTVACLKGIVRFLGQSDPPIFRFQDVLESDLERYVGYIKNRRDGRGAVMARSLSRHLLILNKLFDYRDYLSDYLRYRPSKELSPSKAAGCETYARVATQPIPDAELTVLINSALHYIQNLAPMILNCLRDYNSFAKRNNLESFKSSRSRTWYINKYFFSARKDIQSGRKLTSFLVRLRTACFTMIAFCTGMRVSEVMAIKRNCIRRQYDPNHGIFYWIDSLLFKTQKSNSGSPRSWMCGRVAARAVSVMKLMGRLLSAHKKSRHLLVAFNRFDLIDRSHYTRKLQCLSVRKAESDLKDFCEFHQLSRDIYPHRLRRSFARNIIRYSATPLYALKDHLKHWSLYMTDWYVGLDSELIESLEAERLILSFEAMDKICTQPVGGAGGRRWSKELDARINEGRLPRNFRGKAGGEFRKRMIASLHDSGMMVVPCGDFTYCVFSKDTALCTKGERPIVNKCNPYDCSNSYILPEHVPYYRNRLAAIEVLFHQLSEEENGGPKYKFYRDELVKIRKALEPFTHIEW